MGAQSAGPAMIARPVPTPTFTAVSARRLMRCGGRTCPPGTCGHDDRELHRSTAGRRAVTAAPPIVQEVLASAGQPLDARSRTVMGERFGHDFTRVRVHTDARAAESARAVDAHAYTVGRDVVFAAGRFAPGSPDGQRLLAHELAHVVQQAGSPDTSAPGRGLAVSSPDDTAEREAAAAAADGRSPSVRSATVPSGRSLSRRLAVTKPKDMIPNPGGKGLAATNTDVVQGYLTKLCAAGGVTVDPASGAVGVSGGFCTVPALAPGTAGPAAPSPAQASRTPTGCGCLCDLSMSPHPWQIEVADAAWPNTVFDDRCGCTPGGTGGAVTVPSPNTPRLWGAATASGRQLDIDPWLVLGHELCGHAWLGNNGSAAKDETAPRGEGGHQETVARENALRREHGIELRGTFKEPHCGESYWRQRSSPGKVNWSSYRATCQAWRRDHNARHGTSYRITDRIP